VTYAKADEAVDAWQLTLAVLTRRPAPSRKDRMSRPPVDPPARHWAENGAGSGIVGARTEKSPSAGTVRDVTKVHVKVGTEVIQRQYVRLGRSSAEGGACFERCLSRPRRRSSATRQHGKEEG